MSSSVNAVLFDVHLYGMHHVHFRQPLFFPAAIFLMCYLKILNRTAKAQIVFLVNKYIN
jgi:hypothetical protein